jgi:hypothetical protein
MMSRAAQTHLAGRLFETPGLGVGWVRFDYKNSPNVKAC